MKRLFDYRDQGHSQSGEEGILSRIMEILGVTSGLCCEFGAWDGIHLSNTRKFMENSWRGLMIEADPARFEDLQKTYPNDSGAKTICAFVDDGENSVAKIAMRTNISDRFDLLSIDIDGLDFEIFTSLNEFRKPPLVVIVEVHTCHKPDDVTAVPREIAIQGCGQPLGLFVQEGRKTGYRLVSFIGTNAIFVHSAAGHESELPTMTGMEVALQNLPVIKAHQFAREYLFLVNRGKQQPGYRFNNPLFSWRSLGISPIRAAQLCWKGTP